jgi:SAM-dependent methyltransferase
MSKYGLLYRLGIRPWERYGPAAAASISALLDREQLDRTGPLGRALDLGCGRGQYTPELARRGWEAIGIDHVPSAIAAARAKAVDGVSYVLGDVTDLASTGLGRFDFFLDVGCFQGLDASQQVAEGQGVTALAKPGATLLMLAFGPTRLRWLLEGVTQADVEAAFPGWELLAVDPADTVGLGWPMNRSSPQWYRLRRRAGSAEPALGTHDEGQ